MVPKTCLPARRSDLTWFPLMDVPHYFNVPDGELRRPDSICDPGPQRCQFADTCSNPAFSATWCNKFRCSRKCRIAAKHKMARRGRCSCFLQSLLNFTSKKVRDRNSAASSTQMQKLRYG